MTITIFGCRVRIFQDDKKPNDVHIYVTYKGQSFYIHIQRLGIGLY